MLKLYAMPLSGNSYKVAWMLHLLRTPFQFEPINSIKGETRSPAFLKKNPNGEVPVLELEDGTFLSESNAILLHLAEREYLEAGQQTTTTNTSASYLPPPSTLERAKVYEWMFFEQYSHEPFIAVRSTNRVHGRPCTEERDLQLLQGGHKALQVMESRLNENNYLVGKSLTVADISLFAYTHGAEDKGGYDLSPYPGIQGWLKRIQESKDFGDIDALLHPTFLQQEGTE